jgi:hypothetical protein
MDVDRDLSKLLIQRMEAHLNINPTFHQWWQGKDKKRLRNLCFFLRRRVCAEQQVGCLSRKQSAAGIKCFSGIDVAILKCLVMNLSNPWMSYLCGLIFKLWDQSIDVSSCGAATSMV